MSLGKAHLGALSFYFVKLGDPRQNLRGFLWAGRCRLVKFAPRMYPTAHFDDFFPPEELIIAAVSIRMHIAPVTLKELEGSVLASIMGKIIRCQRGIAAPAHICPQPGLTDFPITLDLKGMMESSVKSTSLSSTALFSFSPSGRIAS